MADTRDDIGKYKKGELTSAEMHALEKKALSDPFLADALEGADSISPEDFSKDLTDIDQRLLSGGRKTTWFTPLRIAAGIVLLMGSLSIIYTINQPDEQLALQKQEVPTTVPSDTITITPENELLSLNQPKEETKTEVTSDLKTKKDASLAKTEGSGETKSTAGISTSVETAPALADNASQVNQVVASELSEIVVEQNGKEQEKIVAAEPAQQDVKKEISRSGLDNRAKAFKSADDVSLQKIVSGQVTSSEDGLPLPGVNVTIKGTTAGTVTDMQGNYSIPVDGEKQKLVFSFIGLQTSEAVSDQTTLNIKLAEDVSQLSEVVVTGQGFKSDRDENESPVIKLAEPVGGRKAYDQYLENSLQYPRQALENNIKGKVTVEFTISTDGTFRDFMVRKSLGFGCDDEVIRLVKEGPKWSPTTEDNVAIESTVRVKMKFDPAKVKK